MGRIRKNIVIDNKNYWTLFDSGSRNNYIIKRICKNLPAFHLLKPQPVSLGGKAHKVDTICFIQGLIKGLPFQMNSRVLENIGKDDDKKNIEILIGALTMQEWGIKLDMEKEELDMTNYPKEFVEFTNF